MLTDIDARVIGFWRITLHEAAVGRVLRVVGGLPGDIVQFDERGRYSIVTEPDELLTYRYGCKGSQNPDFIDFRQSNPSFCTRGVYRLVQEELVMCLAADGASRPDSFEWTADPKWVLKKYIRCEAPKPGKRRKRTKRLTGSGSNHVRSMT